MKELVARIKVVLKRKANMDDTDTLEYHDKSNVKIRAVRGIGYKLEE